MSSRIEQRVASPTAALIPPNGAGFSDNRYRTIVESLPQMVWTLDAEGRCDYLSPQWKEYTGIDPLETSGGWTEHVRPDERDEILERLRASVADGTAFDAECRIKRADGDYLWFRATAAPVRGSKDKHKVTAWFGTCTAIQERKFIEAALRRSEASFRQLADVMPQMVWTAAPDGITYYYNQRSYDYLGLTFGQTTDTEWITKLHPDDQQKYLHPRALCFSTGQRYASEYRFLRASDQTWRWHLERGAPTFDTRGTIAGMIGTCTDIEDYKQATAAIKSLNDRLEERMAKLQNVLDAATQVSIIATDTEGTIQIFNSGAERMLQYQASEMEGVRMLEVIHDSAECAERSQLLSSQAGHPVEGFNAICEDARRGKSEEREWTYVRKDGTRLDVNLAVTAVCDPQRVIQGFLCIATDITARKLLEHEARLTNEKLLAQTKSSEEANLAKSDFLAVMSHEIRTPMNAILGMADLLMESKLDAEQVQYVDVVRHAGANLLVLINDILDLSKIEAGHLELERIPFYLEKVVDEAIELISMKARAKGLRLTCHSSPDLATALVGDPNRLRQVLVNILGNAVKFTDSGAIELSVRNHESGRPGEIEFSISDTGIGIPADKLETIFDDFTQADTSTTRKYGGSGLGLGISRRLVETMRGRLTVSSSVGSGSTFRFNALFEPASAGESKAPVGIEEFSGRRVLVIDSNVTGRLILGETVGAWGLESDLFGELEEALAGLPAVMAGPQPYALALLDSGIGEMDGFQAARRIKQVAKKLPIVMLTTDVRTGDARRRREAGLAAFAVKPVKRDELLRLVCEVIKPREAADPTPLGPPAESACKLEKPLHILLVEDSADNRLLVQAYMKGSRHKLNIAEHGKAAVDRFQVESFDLILMDMQMPVMDGLTATRTIRSIEKERGAAPVPIIALTANARPQDVEMSYQAGCNAHLSKPISKLKLLHAIEELGLPAVRGAIKIEMQPGLEQITPGYLAGRREELPELIALLAASDFQRIAQLAHNLKGTGTSYGFVDLSRIGAALEVAAKQRDPSAADAQLTQLNDYLENIEVVAPDAGKPVEVPDDS